MSRMSESDAVAILVNLGAQLGRMPSRSEMDSATGSSALSNRVSKNGGFSHWAKRLGLPLKQSDSKTGWDGEVSACKILQTKGFTTERSGPVKWPFDIIADGVVRVDVKSARYAEYGPCKGWFYRIGKAPQADVIMLLQLDTQDCYLLPWNTVPRTNITIARDGGKYRRFLNRFDLLHKLVDLRKSESLMWGDPQ